MVGPLASEAAHDAVFIGVLGADVFAEPLIDLLLELRVRLLPGRGLTLSRGLGLWFGD
jgi:hypothetical protein